MPAGARTLLPLYRAHGNERDCRIELYDCAHVELPAMRKVVLEWMNRYLQTGGLYKEPMQM